MGTTLFSSTSFTYKASDTRKDPKEEISYEYSDSTILGDFTLTGGLGIQVSEKLLIDLGIGVDIFGLNLFSSEETGGFNQTFGATPKTTTSSEFNLRAAVTVTGQLSSLLSFLRKQESRKSCYSMPGFPYLTAPSAFVGMTFYKRR